MEGVPLLCVYGGGGIVVIAKDHLPGRCDSRSDKELSRKGSPCKSGMRWDEDGDAAQLEFRVPSFILIVLC